MPAPDPSLVQTAINNGIAYLLRLYKDISPNHGVIGEYPSLPFWIYVHDTGVKHFAGTKYCKSESVEIASTYEVLRYKSSR